VYGNTLGIRKTKNIFGKLLIYTIFILFTVLALFPLIWVFYSSFKPLLEIIRDSFALPKDWIFSNYTEAIRVGKLNIYAINSVIYTFVSSGLVILFSMMASFAFAKLKNRATPYLYNAFLIGLLITIQAILIPLFIYMTKIGLRDTRTGIILIYVAINLPLAIYIATEFIKAIPDSLIESAQIDGASYFTIFFKIIMPMCKPAIITIFIFTALACWNEFVFALIFTSSDSSRSLPVGIYSFSGPFATEYGMQFAALVIGMTPMIIMYALFHKQITRGFVAGGAIKG
jgi:raffinose/stachyose/melibiose transport system permease protein